jgi:subtilisin family serine protease
MTTKIARTRQPWLFWILLPLGAASIVLTMGLSLAQGPAVSNGVKISDRGDVTRAAAKAVPDPLRHVPGELLLRFKHGVSSANARRVLDSVLTVSTRRLRLVDGLYHVKLAPGVSLHSALRTYGHSADIEYAEPNYLLEALDAPSDPSFASQWALQNTGQTGGTAGADIGAVSAWNVTTGSPSVVVAVIDTGVDYTHPDLAANIFTNTLDCNANGVDDDGNGYVDDCHGIDTVNGDSDPMDDNDHGTHVAGTIAAVGNNSLGVAGVNWSASVLPCKFLDANGSGSTAGAIACLDYVATMKDRGVNVVATNNSWGGGLYSQALKDAIQAHQQRGILFVAAAGNSGYDNDLLQSYPCTYDLSNILCVGATDAKDQLAPFSNYGLTSVHLSAPGVGILSTTRGGTYKTFDGTSMATPHVTGTVALLYAQSPGRDWREVKNLVIAGGQTRPLLSGTISKKRLSAVGALTCTSSPASRVQARLKPRRNALTGVAPVELAVLNIDCGSPAGNVVITVNPGGQTVTLTDDGLGRDQVAGDGIYTGLWTPPGGGTFSLGFPDGAYQMVVDPQLAPGFPVQAWAGAGSYQSGAAINTLVGDIDGDPQLEILASGIAQGPLYAWKADGRPVPGWPAVDVAGTAYSTLGELDLGTPGLEVFSAAYGAQPDIAARAGSGVLLPGWPRSSANYVAAPATAADLDGDGLDEIYTEEEDWKLHAYRADGTIPTGWPAVQFVGGQERHTPAIIDLDGDGVPDVLTVSGSGSGSDGDGAYLLAYRRDGTPISGFPVFVPGGYTDTFPAVGDVDGDGALEIVVPARGPSPNFDTTVRVYSSHGTLKWSRTAVGSVAYETAPALADLNGDGIPEIIVQTDSAVNVWRGDGTTMPGWPVSLGTGLWLKNGSPVVGDLDGDHVPEIVVLKLPSSGDAGDVVAFHANGTMVSGFPKHLLNIGSGAVPAIADIDRDGRNELIVTGDSWTGTAGYFDKVWVYALGGPVPHGPAEWPQFMGGPRHQGRYAPVPVASGMPTPTATSTPSATPTGRATATFTVPPTATPTARPTATATSTGTPSSATSFYTLAPCRVLDTRSTAAPALKGGTSRTFALAGQCGIPSTARAVSVNVTITQPTTAGDLRLYPAGATLPLVSVINYVAGQTRANNAVVMLGIGGGMDVRCDQPTGATVQFILDVNGYFQ